MQSPQLMITCPNKCVPYHVLRLYLSIKYSCYYWTNYFHCRPCVLFKNPIAHRSISVSKMTSLDANEALVVYKQDDKTKEVTRYIQFGPTLFVPLSNEWQVLRNIFIWEHYLYLQYDTHISPCTKMTLYEWLNNDMLWLLSKFLCTVMSYDVIVFCSFNFSLRHKIGKSVFSPPTQGKASFSTSIVLIHQTYFCRQSVPNLISKYYFTSHTVQNYLNQFLFLLNFVSGCMSFHGMGLTPITRQALYLMQTSFKF